MTDRELLEAAARAAGIRRNLTGADHMPTSRNGKSSAVVAFVAANPGCSLADICASVGHDKKGGLLSYCVKVGKVFKSGKNKWTRYYQTRELAEANHARHCTEATQLSIARIERQELVGQLRKRARRHSEGRRVANTRKDCIVVLDRETRLAVDVRITSVKAPPGRFEAVGPFVGQITQDWLARRGVAK